jgi:hypothetical protein
MGRTQSMVGNYHLFVRPFRIQGGSKYEKQKEATIYKG